MAVHFRPPGIGADRRCETSPFIRIPIEQAEEVRQIAKENISRVIQDKVLFWALFCQAAAEKGVEGSGAPFCLYGDGKKIYGRQAVIDSVQNGVEEIREFFMKSPGKDFSIKPTSISSYMYFMDGIKPYLVAFADLLGVDVSEEAGQEEWVMVALTLYFKWRKPTAPPPAQAFKPTTLRLILRFRA